MRRQITTGLFAGCIAIAVLSFVERTQWQARDRVILPTYQWGGLTTTLPASSPATRPAETQSRYVRRVYDVEDLLLRVAKWRRTWNGTAMPQNRALTNAANTAAFQAQNRAFVTNPARGALQFAGPSDEEDVAEETFAYLLSETRVGIAPRYLHVWAGRLIVVHTPEGHEQLARLLDEFRRAEVEAWK